MLGCVYYPWGVSPLPPGLCLLPLAGPVRYPARGPGQPMVYMSEGMRAVLTPVLSHMPLQDVFSSNRHRRQRGIPHGGSLLLGLVANSPAACCRARKAEDHLPPSRPGTYHGRRVWLVSRHAVRAPARTAPAMLARRNPVKSRGGVVVVVAPRSACSRGFSRQRSPLGRRLKNSRAQTAHIAAGRTGGGDEAQEVTSAPKHVSTSASALLKSGWSDRRASRSGLSRSTTHSSWPRRPTSTWSRLRLRRGRRSASSWTTESSSTSPQ
jgi:hypothetical protein